MFIKITFQLNKTNINILPKISIAKSYRLKIILTKRQGNSLKQPKV